MASPISPPFSPLLQLQGWGMSRGRRTALAWIDLVLEGPGITVLMGPGGTGKSTLLPALAGHPTAHGEHWGRLLYQGQPLEQAVVPPALAHQQPRELGFSVLENLGAALRQHHGGTP